MKRTFHLILAILAAAALTGGGCDRTPAKPAPVKKTVPAQREWTAQEIAANPQGYLEWSDAQVAQQLANRAQKLKQIADKRVELDGKSKGLVGQIADLENLAKRLEVAYQQAEDEDRFPVRIAGKTVERSKVPLLITEVKKRIEERRPLEQTYKEFFTKMDSTATLLRKDIDELTRLREKLALDIEKVKLNQGIAEVDQLRKTETQLAAMTSAVAAIDQDAMSLPGEPPAKVTIDDLIK
jgi:septal ring factor EnvC (AmiA/AmiB activator)